MKKIKVTYSKVYVHCKVTPNRTSWVGRESPTSDNSLTYMYHSEFSRPDVQQVPQSSHDLGFNPAVGTCTCMLLVTFI